MKRLSISVVILALACIAMAGVASGAGANDRAYTPTITPTSARAGDVQAYVLSVRNTSQGLCQTCTPLHFIQQIKITVPTGFTLVTPLGGVSVKPEDGWNAQISSTVPQVITLTTALTTLVVQKAVTVTINARYDGPFSGCTAQAFNWLTDVNQAVGGGGGNVFSLAKDASYPKVTIGCLPGTTVTLTLVTSNNNSQSIKTTDTNAWVYLTATLNTVDASLPGTTSNQPINFNLPVSIPACRPALTNSSGIATCNFQPQKSPYPFDIPFPDGKYSFDATFPGSATLGGSTSGPEVLEVNADGSGLTVSNATGTYGGTVDVSAHLTASTGDLSGKPITFYIDGANKGTANTGTNGVASLSGVSIAGIGVGGPYDNDIKASFAGDGVYLPKDAFGNLTVTQQGLNIIWGPLAPITYGTPLGGTQLNATVDLVVSGTFTYCLGTSASAPCTPGLEAPGAVLTGGPGQSLSVIFVPTDHNYPSPTKTVMIDVQPANQSITFGPLGSKTYGDADFTVTATASSTLTVSFDTSTSGVCTVTPGGSVHIVAVGTCTITAHQGGTPSFNPATPVSQSFAVGQKAATVTAVDKNKAYGDDNPALTATVGGTFGTDALNYSLGTTAVKFSGIGTYPITVTLGLNPNYSVTKTDATLTVGQKAATVTADPKSKLYGTANPGLTATVVGTVNSDTLNYTLATTATSTSGVGPYPITVTLGTNPNYSVTSSDSTLTINQALASVTPNAAGKVYGGPEPTLTGTLSGFLPADSVSATYSRAAGETVAGGPYLISAVLAPSGILANYNITYNTANFAITPADQTIQLTPFSGTMSSNGALTFGISGAGCAVNSTTGLVAITGTATCLVTATADSNHNTTTRTITITIQ